MKNKEIPKVSIIIPTYNRCNLIRRALKSAIAQTYQNLEIIVVDDASTDKTEEIVKSICSNKIKYIKHKKNKGVGAAGNTGVNASKSEFIAFLGDDDEWLPKKIEKQISIFTLVSRQVGVVYTQMWRVSNNYKYFFRSPIIVPEDGLTYLKFLSGQIEGIGTGAALIRRDCFDKVGRFDEILPCYVDTDFFIRVSRFYYFYCINEPLVIYYQTLNNISTNLKNRLVARKLIFEKYRLEIEKNKKILAQHFLRIGEAMLCCNIDKEGKKYIYKAYKVDPINFKMGIRLLIAILGSNIFTNFYNIRRMLKNKFFNKYSLIKDMNN